MVWFGLDWGGGEGGGGLDIFFKKKGRGKVRR